MDVRGLPRRLRLLAAFITLTAGAIPLAAQSNCVGDCNLDTFVRVNELVTGVNIALDIQPLTSCPSFDASVSSSVEVNELILAVNGALNGCPPPPAAPITLRSVPPPETDPVIDTRAGDHLVADIERLLPQLLLGGAVDASPGRRRHARIRTDLGPHAHRAAGVGGRGG